MQTADYNLNPFIDDRTFYTEKLEIADDILLNFFKLLPQIVLEDEKESFLRLIENYSKYKNCTDFFSWLCEYVERISNLCQMTKEIRKLNSEDFEHLFDYCLENLILHNFGLEAIVNEKQGQELYYLDNLKSMTYIINMYYSWIFIKGGSKYDADRSILEAGITEDKCLIFWKKYLQNEDALWKKYSLILQNEINNKLELFIKSISTIEEEE